MSFSRIAAKAEPSPMDRAIEATARYTAEKEGKNWSFLNQKEQSEYKKRAKELLNLPPLPRK